MSVSGNTEAGGTHLLTAVEIEVLVNGPKVPEPQMLKVALTELIQSGAIRLARVDTPRFLRQPTQRVILTRGTNPTLPSLPPLQGIAELLDWTLPGPHGMPVDQLAMQIFGRSPGYVIGEVLLALEARGLYARQPRWLDSVRGPRWVATEDGVRVRAAVMTQPRLQVDQLDIIEGVDRGWNTLRDAD